MREKKFAEGYVCLTCYRTVEKCSFLESLLQTQTHRQHWSMHVQSLSLAPRHLLTLSDLVVNHSYDSCHIISNVNMWGAEYLAAVPT